MILRCGELSCALRVFSNFPGLYPLDAGGTHAPRVVTSKNVSRCCQISTRIRDTPGGELLIYCETIFLLFLCILFKYYPNLGIP